MFGVASWQAPSWGTIEAFSSVVDARLDIMRMVGNSPGGVSGQRAEATVCDSSVRDICLLTESRPLFAGTYQTMPPDRWVESEDDQITLVELIRSFIASTITFIPKNDVFIHEVARPRTPAHYMQGYRWVHSSSEKY